MNLLKFVQVLIKTLFDMFQMRRVTDTIISTLL